ncbi:MAG: ERCC4 domain-containing protein [Nanoarchaeota archaeon]
MKQIKLISNFSSRTYQQSIFANSMDKNSLVVLPTGLGKTVIALMLCVYYYNKTNRKVLFLAPTKPLVEQQKKSFEDFFENKDDFVFEVLTGQVSPKKRQALYNGADFVFSTPQLVENDILNKTIPVQDFDFVVIDEAHRATGNYAYGFIAGEFEKQGAKVLALTASPGTSKEQIEEVMNTLRIDTLQVKKYSDSDVKPYTNKTEIEAVKVELNDEFKKIKKLLDGVYQKWVEELKKLEILDKSKRFLTKKDILDLQMELRAEIASGGADENVWKGISLAAGLMKLGYGIELFESQEVSAAHSYFYNFFRSGGDSSKAAEELTRNIDFREAFDKISKLKEAGILHPKLVKLKELVNKELLENKDLRIIVFSQYRESGLKIVDELSKIKELKPVLFVGQAKKNGGGLSQKKQKEILDDFRVGKYNILVSTSVGEEGLDIPKVDLVCFYEPVASAIRSIQRIGRTGRFKKGKAYVLQTEGTRDIVTKHIASAKERKMYKVLDEIRDKVVGTRDERLENRDGGLSKFLKNEVGEKETSSKLNFDKFNIVIDSRENQDLQKELFKRDELNVKAQSLEVGDIVISDRLAIERKSKLDFVNSIIEKKIFRQVKDLAINYKRPILILEGDENIYSLRNVNSNVIRAAISAISIDFRVPIIFTNSMQETADFILTFAKRENKEKTQISLADTKTSFSEFQEIEKVVSTIPRINVVTAKNLLKKFKSVKKMANAKEKDFLDVDGIGKTRAKSLKDFFEREWKEL